MSDVPFGEIIRQINSEATSAARQRTDARAQQQRLEQERQSLSQLACNESRMVSQEMLRRGIPTIDAVPLGVALTAERKYRNGPWYRDIVNPQGSPKTPGQVRHDQRWYRGKMERALAPHVFPVWDMDISFTDTSYDGGRSDFFLGTEGYVYAAWQGKGSPVGVGSPIDFVEQSSGIDELQAIRRGLGNLVVRHHLDVRT